MGRETGGADHRHGDDSPREQERYTADSDGSHKPETKGHS